jgi:hypothetical protein
MSTNNAFRSAVELTLPIYNTAVIHTVAELRASQWCNLYTSVIYGREIDLLSVPDYVDHAVYSQSVLCLRVRLSRSKAEAFVESARNGSANCDSWRIEYATREIVFGFRPATSFGDMNEQSFWGTSLWSREAIGIHKIFNGRDLQRSNAWKVADYLSCLKEARWLPIPLQRHPEKLEDLDEIWPSPLSLKSNVSDGTCELEVTSIDASLLTREITVIGTLLQNDLIVRALHFSGRGPHRVNENIDAINVLVTIDGVPMDAQAYHFIRSITTQAYIYSGANYMVPKHGARPEMRFSIVHADPNPSIIGTPRTDTIRHEAWIIGRVLRSYSQPGDAENVYDPIANGEAVEQAFNDLQQYGKNEASSEILVADPYALEERALHAIAVMATRQGQAKSVRVLTQFHSAPKVPSWLTQVLSVVRKVWPWCSVKQTARAKVQADAMLLAQKIATQLNVSMAFYTIKGLHDRFLLVGERLWHVGCSFNTLGQEISAVVEMRDERAKSAVLDIFERVTLERPVFEVKP